MTAEPAATPGGFRHEAFLYRSLAEFVDSTVSFVRDGLAGDEDILVAVVSPKVRLLRDALGSAAGRVRFLNMEEVGRNPARIIPAWREFVDDATGADRPFRGVGEPIWVGRRGTEVVECQLHEALLNRAFDGGPSWILRCPYDASALDPGIVTAVAETHPGVVDGGAWRGSHGYADDLAARTFAGLLPEPPADAVSLRFGLAELAAARALVTDRAAGLGIEAERVADLGLAVHEVMTNSIRHGGGGGTVAVWRSGDALVAEVRDSGRITEPLTGRVLPSFLHEGGRGLWLAHQLCDLVQVRSPSGGTRVRIHTWL